MSENKIERLSNNDMDTIYHFQHALKLNEVIDAVNELGKILEEHHNILTETQEPIDQSDPRLTINSDKLSMPGGKVDKDTCSECGGSGYTDIAEIGEVTTHKPCPACTGTGNNGYDGVRAGFCTTCNGSGKDEIGRPCYDCDTDKKDTTVTVTHANLHKCTTGCPPDCIRVFEELPIGENDCPACSGFGGVIKGSRTFPKLLVVDCLVCNGTGKKKELAG